MVEQILVAMAMVGVMIEYISLPDSTAGGALTTSMFDCYHFIASHIGIGMHMFTVYSCQIFTLPHRLSVTEIVQK